MVTPCPCCGQEVDTHGVMFSFDSNCISRHGYLIRLLPAEAEMFAAIFEHYPERITIEQLWLRVYGTPDRGPETPNSLRASISRMKRMIVPLGLDIDYYREGFTRNGGYRLVIHPHIPGVTVDNKAAQENGKAREYVFSRERRN